MWICFNSLLNNWENPDYGMSNQIDLVAHHLYKRLIVLFSMIFV